MKRIQEKATNIEGKEHLICVQEFPQKEKSNAKGCNNENYNFKELV